MANLFDLDQKDLKQLEKTYRKFPRQFQAAAAGVLSSQAYKLRQSIMQTMESEFEIRNPRFLSRQVRFQKANHREPISRQESIAGSVKQGRFSGWLEQETGEPNKSKHVPTNAARDYNFKNTVSTGLRLKPGRRYKKPGDFGSKIHKTYGQKVVAMIEASRKGDNQKPFVIEKGGGPGKLQNFKYGLHTIIAGEVSRVQTFGKNWNPKRHAWMDESLSLFARKFDLKATWKKELEFRLRRK